MTIPTSKLSLTAEKFAEMYLNNIVAIMGIPYEIVSDDQNLITSKLFRTLCQLSGIMQKQSILYRPRGNGRAEAAVHSIVDMLRRTLQGQYKQWIYALPWVTFMINDLPGVLQE